MIFISKWIVFGWRFSAQNVSVDLKSQKMFEFINIPQAYPSVKLIKTQKYIPP